MPQIAGDCVRDEALQVALPQWAVGSALSIGVSGLDHAAWRESSRTLRGIDGVAVKGGCNVGENVPIAHEAR